MTTICKIPYERYTTEWVKKLLEENPHAIKIKHKGVMRLILLRNSQIEIKEGNICGFPKEAPGNPDGKFSFPISGVEILPENYFLY